MSSLVATEQEAAGLIHEFILQAWQLLLNSDPALAHSPML